MFKIISGIATLMILVSGMGLIARLGFNHGEPWPLWAILKVVIWLVLSASLPIISKRFPKLKPMAYWLMLVGLVFAAWLVNFKPD